MQYKSFTLVVLVAVLFSVKVSGQKTIQDVSVSYDKSEIIDNRLSSGKGTPSRNIFIWMEENQFNLEEVKKTFNRYKNLYPDPFNLQITIYTDKAMLQKIISFEKQPVTIEFSNDDKGRESERRFYEKYYPLPKGYYRAKYFRYGTFEFFDYSPQKNRVQMKRVTIKSQAEKLISSNSRNSIFEAVKDGDSQAVEILLRGNVKIDSTDEKGFTPFLLAASHGQTEIVSILAKRGADLYIRNNNELGALDLACLNEMTDSVKMLLELGFDVNVTGLGGVTPLMIASEVGNTDIIKILIDKGANVNLQTKFGITALMAATNDLDVTKSLLQSGAKTEITDNNGWTALFYSVRGAQDEKLEVLLEAGAKISLTDKNSQTPISIANNLKDDTQKKKIIALLKSYAVN